MAARVARVLVDGYSEGGRALFKFSSRTRSSPADAVPDKYAAGD